MKKETELQLVETLIRMDRELAELRILVVRLNSVEAPGIENPIVDIREVMVLSKKKSPSAAYRWLDKVGVKPVTVGRYSRSKVLLARIHEAGGKFQSQPEGMTKKEAA